ncbi:YoaK family protein [Bdellovibrio sp. HCB185ZH]|uniref:YoaK family protein n=1 Tax=Bdellovibrio sp. HCB185ZH TaxID=3394235 RepID=UPI0039A5B68C
MLYGNESISHYTRSNILIWMLMAFQAGVLNMGGFMACHRFVSHVTGFATFFGYEYSQKGRSHAWGMLVVPLFFLFGAMVSGYLVDIRLKLHKKPKYYIAYAVMLVLILIATFGGWLGWFGPFGASLEESRNGYLLLILLCFTCGVQNGTITSVSRSVVRTTHLTGITTDLGIGLVRIFNKRILGTEHTELVENEYKATSMRLGIITMFVLGSVFAGFVYPVAGFWGFLIPAFTTGILLVSMIYFQIINPRKKQAAV